MNETVNSIADKTYNEVILELLSCSKKPLTMKELTDLILSKGLKVGKSIGKNVSARLSKLVKITPHLVRIGKTPPYSYWLTQSKNGSSLPPFQSNSNSKNEVLSINEDDVSKKKLLKLKMMTFYQKLIPLQDLFCFLQKLFLPKSVFISK